MKNINTTIILDTRRVKNDKTYPVKLRVTFGKKQKMYGIQLSMTEADYSKSMSLDSTGKYKKNFDKFTKERNRANDVIKNIVFFTFDKFEEQYFIGKKRGRDVYSYYEDYIEQLRAEQRFGTAESYQTSYQSIKVFYNKKELLFEDVTNKFLNDYEHKMVNAGKSMTTVGIYLRCLRKLFNDYIEDVSAPRGIYPFGRNKYIIPKGRNIKKALKLEQIGMIYNFAVKEKSEIHFAKDMFMLSYFCNGMNLGDIFRLKFKNIDGDLLMFYRKKTIRTAKADYKPVIVILTDEIKKILSFWQNKSQNQDDFILPLLNNIVEPELQRKTIKYKTKTININIKRIFEELGFNIEGSTIYARHSYSTIMRNLGASVEFISESLGQQNTQVTKHYLDSFEDDIKREFAKKLTAFKTNIGNGKEYR